METIMITKNMKAIKKVSYYGLTLFSTVLTLAAPAAEFCSKDFVDHPVKGGTMKIPRQPANPFDFLEKEIKLLFGDHGTNKNEVEIDLQSPAMDTNKERYAFVKNKIIDKYEKDRPELARFRTHSLERNKQPTLVKDTIILGTTAKRLKQKFEQDNKDLQETGETAVNIGYSLLEEGIHNNVNNPVIKELLLNGLYKAQEEFLNFFKQ